ncbi:MAG: hypothetical protein SGJ27_28800 [Candidatus Melainabacteria bacterium]|nr:hypothetical protein [Candidatus Melainabacteria bacterium]
MNVRNLAATLVLALSLPVAVQGSAIAQDNLVLSTGTDTQANIDQAKERLDKAKIRFEISQKQVDAARARLKAADAELKAAKANSDARALDHQAKQLSDASGLPEITEGQIEQNQNQNRAKALASKEIEAAKEVAPVVTPAAPATPVDMYETRLKQTDFNNQQPESDGAPVPAAPANSNSNDVQSSGHVPQKQALFDSTFNQVAATSAPTISDQAPAIVP